MDDSIVGGTEIFVNERKETETVAENKISIGEHNLYINFFQIFCQ